MKEDLLLTEIAAYVEQLYNSCKRTYLLYHNLEHTKQVVEHADEIATHYSLDKRSRFVLLAAAWFHDTGQLTGDVIVHEETGVQFMKDFLFDKKVSKKTMEEIAQCIMVTKMPVAPVTQLEKIICDADTWHLGSRQFYRLDTLVWKEMELRLNTSIHNQLEKSLQFLISHRFYTDYCQERLGEGKQRNIKLLKSLMK